MGEVCLFLVLIIFPCFGFHLACALCTAAPPTVTENMSVVTDNSPNFLPRLNSELASQHPLVSVIQHYNIVSVFITYENLKSFTTRVALKTIIFVMDLVTCIIVVILLSPLKYNLSQYAFLPVVRSEWVA